MRFVLSLLVLSLPLALAAKRPVTLNDVLASRESAAVSPIWAPDGKSFLYEKHDSVYRFRIGSEKASLWFDKAALASSKDESPSSSPFDWQNRRVSHDDLQWSPNSKQVLVSAAGSVYLVHGNGKKERLSIQGTAENPALSPDGKLLVFRAQHNLYLFDLASKKARQLTHDGSETLRNGELDWVYPEELDLGTAVWWSPDSRQIAYLQFDIAHEFIYPQADLLKEHAIAEPERYPQAGTPNANVRLGVASAEGGPTVWMQLPVNADTLLARVAWLPDSSRVATQLMPRIQNSLDLFFSDPKTGASKPIIHEASKTWVNIADNLLFLSGKSEFFWTSERSGFRHVYRYATNGELLGQVTSGEWEVKSIAGMNQGSQTLYYTASEDSPLETHLYSVPFSGGARTRITALGFDHKIGMDPAGTYFVDEASSLSVPPETVLRDSSGKTLSTLVERNTSAEQELELSKPEIVQVTAEDGTVLYGRLLKPLAFQSGHKYPVIVRVYGGPTAQAVRNDWPGIGMDQLLAANGYVVWQLDNRGSAGRGHVFEDAVYRKLGGVEVTDQRKGVQHLVEMGIADPERIGVTGWSYGGYMTLRCLLLAGDMFKAGVAGAPVTDWRNYDTIYTERYMGLPSQNKSGYAQASNVAAAGNLQGKLLIQHNLEDDNVLFQNTMQFINALDQHGRPYLMQLYGQKTHGVTGDQRRLLYQSALDFFARNL